MIQTAPRMLSAQEALEIPDCICPTLVLTDNLTSWVSREIKAHTHGHYSHAMWLWYPEALATQGWRFTVEWLGLYLKGQHRVKFWYNPDWSAILKERMQERLKTDVLNAKKYDWLGIMGQLLGVRGLNFSKRNYCSEEAGMVLHIGESMFRMKHPSPADLDVWCKAAPQMEVYGIFDPTL